MPILPPMVTNLIAVGEKSGSLDDMLDSRPGGVVRMLDDSMPGEGHIVPVVHPFAFQEIIGSLEYFDQERQNRSGASRICIRTAPATMT